MKQKTKYIDGKNLLANKEHLGVRIPKYLNDDLKNYADLTGANITDIVTTALFNFFKHRTLTNTELLGYGNLFFKMPLTATFKADAIANKIKLNIDIETTEPTEAITITTVTNNLDIFNGNTYFAGSELEKENIKHIGLDFAIIPTAIKPTESIKFNELDININDSLYIFYYEITSVNIIDVYLINPIDAVNKLASVKSIKTNEKLVSCLQELETIQAGVNKKFADEMRELHSTNKYVSNDKKLAVKDKYTAILLELLTDVAIKYNSDNIKIGSGANTYSFQQLKERIKDYETSQSRIKKILDSQEQESQQ